MSISAVLWDDRSILKDRASIPILIIFESGINNRPPGTKLGRSGTKGRRRPGTTHNCVNLGLRRPEEAWDWTFCWRREI